MCVCAEKLDVCFFVLLVFLYLNYTTARVHDTGAERRWLLVVGCVCVCAHACICAGVLISVLVFSCRSCDFFFFLSPNLLYDVE